MQLGLVIETNDPGTAWNGFRFGVAALEEGHTVWAFLLGDGVEAPDQPAKADVNPHGMVRKFTREGGEMLACGTCMDHRDMEPDDLRPRSTMTELVSRVEAADTVLTFG